MGKSSIVEAIEFFFTGKLSYFEGTGTQTLSMQKHCPHKNFSAENVNVTITFNPDSLCLSRNFDECSSPPEQLTTYFEIAKRGTFLLRRAQILNFIASRPSDRFRAIASIIGIEQLDEIELEMKRLCDELEGRVSSEENERSKLFNEISELIGQRISKCDDILPVLNNKLAELKVPPVNSFAELEGALEDKLNPSKQTQDYSKIRLINEILGIIEQPFFEKSFDENLNEISKKINDLLKDQDAIRGTALIGLLEKGRQVLNDSENNICPLCGQTIEREKILKIIEKRLKTLSQLTENASSIRQNITSTEEQAGFIKEKIRSLILKVEQFSELTSHKSSLVKNLDNFNILGTNLESAKNFDNPINIKGFNKYTKDLLTIIKNLSQKCKQIIDNICLPEGWKNFIELLKIIEQIKVKIENTNEISSKLEINKKHLKLSKKIYDEFSETKNEKLEEIYKEISKNLDAYYSKIHPDDSHKNIELKVVTGRRASSGISMESFGRQGEDPRALTSEGHQDSLGLCIFLAFVKRFNEGCNLIVLDDVVSTIDSKHRGRICDLLFEEFGDYQFIITTHDGVWYEELRAYQRAYGVDGKFRNLEIVSWDSDLGPTIEPFKPQWERIKEKFNKSDKKGLGNEGRQYLEWLLKEICETTLAELPYTRKNKRTVADLLAPCKTRLEKLLNTQPQFIQTIHTAFRDLEKIVIMGNLLSHDNLLIENVSISEAMSFCDAIHNLKNIFSCPTCGTMMKYYQELKILRCSNTRCDKPIEVKCC